nr:immunoglobulin light chain junction region [Macaca mulatta]
CFQDVQIPPSF